MFIKRWHQFSIIILLLFLNTVGFSAQENIITQNKIFKISKESIASLSVHLSKEKFATLETQLLDKEYNNKISRLIDKLKRKSFSNEEIQRVKTSLAFYFEILVKINRIAPLVSTIDKRKQAIAKKEKKIDSLMNNEKEEVLKEIKKLKKQQANDQEKFKRTIQELDLDDLNFDKLPGMLADLGYDASFYQVIYEQLSAYLSIAKKITTASAIIKSLEKITDDIHLLERQLKRAKNEEQKKSIVVNLKKLVERKKILHQNFTLNSTGIDQNSATETQNKTLDWEEELKKVFSPVIINLKELTEPTRKIEFLHADIAYYEQQIPKIKQGIEQIDILILESHNKKLKQKLLLEKKEWEQKEKELNTKYDVAKQQIIDLENDKISPEQALNAFKDTIFSKEGKNILLSMLVFFLTFIGLHIIRKIIFFINPLNYIARFKFIASLIDILLNIFIFIVSILTLMVALYLAGSMMTLAIVVFVLIGMLWTVRNTIPYFFEQIKLLLGYGAVRQGEKIIYNGMQWLVESIGVYSYLKNPLLTSNIIRLPLKDLINMRSRPYDKKEGLFPCKEGDYILINNKTFRQVAIQSPERIILDAFGMKDSMPTKTFLQQTIRNLSNGPFWAGVTFYISYEHRYEVMDEVVSQLEGFLEDEFKKSPFGEYLVSPWVAFSELTDVSLGILAWVKVTPEAAPKYNAIKMRLTQICLKAANKYGWQILKFHAITQHEPIQPVNEVTEILPKEIL